MNNYGINTKDLLSKEKDGFLPGGYTKDYDKVVDTIASCETEEHLKGATRMALNLYNKYLNHPVAKGSIAKNIMDTCFSVISKDIGIKGKAVMSKLSRVSVAGIARERFDN